MSPNPPSPETATSWACLTDWTVGSSISTLLCRFVMWRAGYDDNVRRQTGRQAGKPWWAEQQRKSQSGWQTCSRVAQRRAGRQEVWGGRLQREQTAGMFNYHTREHDKSSSLTAAQRPGVARCGTEFSLCSVWILLRLSAFWSLLPSVHLSQLILTTLADLSHTLSSVSRVADDYKLMLTLSAFKWCQLSYIKYKNHLLEKWI